MRALALVFCALVLPVFAAEGFVDGIYYEEQGTGAAVILIHGGQMDRRMWDSQFDEFAKEFRVVRYDLRGFGKSLAPTKAYSHEEDLARLLDKLKIDKARLVGLSLGAAVAMDFALTHSNRVAALLLVCPGMGGFPFQDAANNLEPVVIAARDKEPKTAADLWLANPYMAVAMENPTLRPKLRMLAEENAQCWLNNPLLQRRLRPPAYARLKEISAPTLAVDGERDVSDIHKIVEKIAAEIPNARKKMVKLAGHLVPMEKGQEFNELALEFMRGAQR
ncbi:MAG TPA: alpha/beta hydrolase [Verrucomicrobiae bacterium]|nr:alpha/beta hydrolase [Verrucomicrobiae bacterium]